MYLFKPCTQILKEKIFIFSIKVCTSILQAEGQTTKLRMLEISNCMFVDTLRTLHVV